MDDSPLAAWLRDAPPDDDGWEAGASPGRPAAGAGREPEPATPPPHVPVGPLPWDEDGAAPTPKRRRLLLLAGVPWLVLALVAVGLVVRRPPELVPAGGGPAAPAPGVAGSRAVPGDATAAGGATAAGDGAKAGDATAAGDATGADDVRLAPAATSEAAAGAAGARAAGAGITGDTGPGAGGTADERQALEAAAVTAVRAGVTRLVAGDQRYVDAVAVERIRWTGSVAVVAVRAVVLEGHGSAWTAARVERLAVPVERTGDGYVAVAPAWPLALAAPPPPRWRPVDDSVLAAAVTAALTGAGWSGVRLDTLERSARIPGALRVRLRARAPGAGQVAASEVWLTDEPQPRVLGTAEVDR